MLSFLTLRGVTVGMIAGFASGLLGVSPGGILVPAISILLPYSQHVAQGISLVAQAPPTSIAGLSAYSRSGQEARFSSVRLRTWNSVVGSAERLPSRTSFSRSCSRRRTRTRSAAAQRSASPCAGAWLAAACPLPESRRSRLATAPASDASPAADASIKAGTA